MRFKQKEEHLRASTHGLLLCWPGLLLQWTFKNITIQSVSFVSQQHVNSWVWPVWSVRVVFPISGVCVCLANLYMLVGHRSLQNPDGLAWNQIIIVIAFFFCLPHEDGRNSNLFPEPRSVARSRSLASADGICGLGNYLRRLVCYAFGMYSTKWFTALTR